MKRATGHSSLPEDVTSYRRTAEFTEATVPAGLLRSHSTKEGVWGLIHVLEGELLYKVTDARRPTYEAVLDARSAPGVVEPTILHEVQPRGGVRFFVEFYRSRQ